MIIKPWLIFVLINIGFSETKSYDNYSLFGVVPIEVEHLKFLQNLEKQKYISMVYWKKPLKLYHDVQFMVDPVDKDLFIERANHFKMKTDLLIADVQAAFDQQTIKRYFRLKLDSYTWDYYHTLEDINEWLTDLALKFPTLVELISIGKSAQNKEINVVIIKRGNPTDKVIVEAGLHGNEWVSTEFVTYLAHQLVYNNDTNRFRKLAKDYIWYLLPVANPDGYEYCQEQDRLYRKNRRPIGNTFGVDLNRNFNYSFGTHDTSTDPEDELYCGDEPFSEPETKALKTFIDKNADNLKFYFSIHSYGQKIIIPYSDRINHVEDYAEMENYGKQAILRMYKLYGRKYSVGTYYDTMGLRISGNSASWVKKRHQVKHVFTFLLRDNGTYGYALPVNQILPACREALAGMTEIMTAKVRRFRTNIFNSSTNSNIDLILICIVVSLFYLNK